MRALALAALLVFSGCASTFVPTEGRTRREDQLVKLLKEPGASESYENQWNCARLCDQMADPDIEGRPGFERYEIAKRGLEHAKQAIKLSPRAPEGHFYDMINQARLVEAQSLPQSDEVRDLILKGEAMVRIDETYDSAGAHRLLGILYASLPETGPFGWGSYEKADENFAKALQLAPDFPENQIAYGEFELEKMENPEAARPLLEKGRQLLDTYQDLSDEERAHLRKKVNELLEKCK
jgi:tetratricopeptide (TPR) repeat protein